MENPHHCHRCEVAFADTDASGWMHFPNVFKYVEAAEHAFLKLRQVLVFDRALGGWPRVKVTCDYKRPLQYGDAIEVQLAITRIGASSLHWDFEVINAAGEIAAFGKLTTVRVDHQGRPQLISEAERQSLGSSYNLNDGNRC
jgi:acyl-CoA thioester hydrolase